MNTRSAAEIKFLKNQLQQLEVSNVLKELVEICIEEFVKQQYFIFDSNKAILIGIIKGYNPSEQELLQLFHTYREQDAHFNNSRAAYRYIVGKVNDKYGTDIPAIPAVDLQLLFNPEPEAVKQHYFTESKKFYILQDELLKVVMKMVVTTAIWSQMKEIMDLVLNKKEMDDVV